MSSFISSYIITIISISISSFICETITSTANETLRKGQRLITTLCIFIAVVLPICQALVNISPKLNLDGTLTQEENTAYCTKAFSSLVADEAEKRLSEQISKNFGIHPDDICINIIEESNDTEKHLVIDTVNIFIKADSITKNKITQFISQELDVEDDNIQITGEENND